MGNKKLLLALFWIWFALSSIAGLLFIDFYASVYYIMWVGILGNLFYWKRKQLKVYIKKWKIAWQLKFIFLALLMILIEEAFVGILKPLSIGSLSTIPLTILKTQFFNLIALGTLVLGWALLLSYFYFSLSEILVTTGLFGAFFYEGLRGIFAQGLLSGVWSFPLLTSAHAMIYLLPYLVVGDELQKKKKTMMKWLFLIFMMLFVYVASGFILSILAEKVPYLLPLD